MRKAINSTSDFEIDPSVSDLGGEIVFVDELIGDVGKFDTNIFEAIKRRAQIEILDAKASKFGTPTGQDTIENKLGKFEGTSRRADVTRVANEVATNGDARAV